MRKLKKKFTARLDTPVIYPLGHAPSQIPLSLIFTLGGSQYL